MILSFEKWRSGSYIAVLCGVIVVNFVLAQHVAAQTQSPQLILTWEAETYAPPGYAGRTLPTSLSRVHASLLLVHRGTLANLTPYTIYWYLENNLIQGGKGVQDISFFIPRLFGAVTLRARVEDYPGGAVTRTIEIPVVRPEVVIRGGGSGKRLSGSVFTFESLPYYFNVLNLSALSFWWNVNGELPTVTTRPHLISVEVNDNIAPGTPLRVQSSVKNPVDDLEAASLQTTFTIIP